MRALRSILPVLAAIAATAGCATPGPVPPPQPPAPSSFVCAGPASVPDFDAIANELVLAAEQVDDAAALGRMDQVAAVVGVAQTDCVIGEILPDLRAAPVTGLHLEMWQARERGK